ncbi:MAG: hypothetical protein JO222_10825, partial [Frankiales bacterium]|nr:hypothetical protein [Frankiales bacterium]
SGRVGALVAMEASAADGGPSRIVARQVTFNSTSGSTTPPYFYAVKSQRIAQFNSATGAFSRYLTTYQPGGGPSDPQLGSTGDTVYFLQGNGTCANTLMSVSAAGGAEQLVANPVTGYVITGFAVGPAPAAGNGTAALALVESKCAGTHGAQAKLVTTDSTGARHVIKFPSTPPVIEADPSWAVPTTQPWTTEDLVAWVRTGNQGYLADYNVPTDTTATPTRNACPSYDVNSGMPTALEVDGTGALWFATQTGSSMDVVRCDSHGSTTEFSVPGQDTPSDVDVTSDGTAVLLTDLNGKVWRWSGSGNAVQLPTVADHVTW